MKIGVVLLTVFVISMSCTQLTLTQISDLRMGMTESEAYEAIKMPPDYEIDVVLKNAPSPILVQSYTLSSGNYKSDYFIAFENGRIIFWGYPHEFARSTNKKINYIGSRALERLDELKPY